MNKKFLAVMFLTLGIAIGHGFSTLYQYVETLGGDYTSQPQRDELLNSDIQNGEPMKASTLNAKFSSMNAELGDLESRIISLESTGSSSGGGGYSLNKIHACGLEGFCLATVSGRTFGSSVVKNYLVAIDMNDSTPNAYIVYRQANALDILNQFDAGYHSTNESLRIKDDEIIEVKNCSTDFCLATVSGRTFGETVEKNYLVAIDLDSTPNAYIVHRQANAVDVVQQFDLGYYSTNESLRIKDDEIISMEVCANIYCGAVVKGRTFGETVEKNYLVAIDMDSTPNAYIIHRQANTADVLQQFDSSYHSTNESLRLEVQD